MKREKEYVVVRVRNGEEMWPSSGKDRKDIH
jgi:hypothetical protein